MPLDEHINISVKSSHNQEETEDPFRNMECQDNLSGGKTGGGMQGHG
jgi:hypothetical protein